MTLKEWTKSHKNDYGALTKELFECLAAGDRVRFKWHGNSTTENIGRIEISHHGVKYFVPEHCYENGQINPYYEGMRYYNPLSSYYMFTEFEVKKP